MFSFFTDPILRAPTIGCMLMCLSASIMGVAVFLRRESLIGETLAHASYPGIILGVLTAGLLSAANGSELLLSLFALSGAFVTALMGVWAAQAMQKHLKVPPDAALCFVLSTFFGVGLTIASEVQFSYTSLYRQAIGYIYGQAATMTDIHIAVYGILAFFAVSMVVFLQKEIQAMTFDRQFAKSLGMQVRSIETLLFILVSLAVIIGIRSVGVVLMSAMLIAPAVAARQFTNRLSSMFILAAVFGALSGFFGNYFSVRLTEILSYSYPKARIILPTGPMIVLTAAGICGFALLFAPERGLLLRSLRISVFRRACICENILKAIWRINPHGAVTLNQVAKYQSISLLHLKFLMRGMVRNGWLERQGDNGYQLTDDGRLRAAKIVRLHRLWEVYLTNYLGIGGERVHCNAEEMEHVLTPELELELTRLLEDPKVDPHHQPIPPREEGWNAS